MLGWEFRGLNLLQVWKEKKMEQQRRRITTVRQLEMLLEFLEVHRDLALGRIKSKEYRATADRLWRQCSDYLNPFGAVRTGKEWAKAWNDLKCKVRAKLTAINTSRQGTGGGPNVQPTLTPLETRVACIIGMDVGPLPNVMQDQFASSAGDGFEEEIEQTENEFEAENISPPLVLRIPFEGRADSAEPAIPSTAAATSSQVPSTSQHQHAAAVDLTEAADTPRAPTADRVVLRARDRRRRTERQRTHTSASAQEQVSCQAQSSRSMLDESRQMVLRIEQLRAEAALNNSQATMQNAQAMNTLAESFKLFCESIDRLANQCSSSQQNSRQPEP